jgi:signal transduction histidine kinase
LIAAAGLFTYFAFVAATRRIFLFDLGAVAPIFTALIVLNLVMAATAARWASWRRLVLVYQAGQVLLCSVVLHELGGLMMGSLLITYAFPVILSEIHASDGSVWLTANLAAASYAALAWWESHWLADVGIDYQQQVALVVFAFLALNFLALYTDRYGNQLRNLARHLQAKVAERTAALTTLNEELASKARALEEKQDELRTFVYAVTHDLKAPLNAILLTADLVLAREAGALGGETRDDLGRIVRLAGGTEDMIRDLLEMFRITSQPETAAWVDLEALVRGAVDALGVQLTAKGVAVAVGQLPNVWGQERKLGHVVTNLLGNALKYVPTGRGRVDVAGALENGSVVLRVHDNGIGIPPAYHRGIFELFGRVPDPEREVDGAAPGGTGVGLAIVKRIVESHRGTVRVDSAAGQGAVFTVRLPANGGGRA